MPYITQGASRKLEKLHIFGKDYDTPDGTCIRDYIHVVDLARGHVNALKAIQDNCGLAVYNLGTGKGYSVLELVEAFERVNGISRSLMSLMAVVPAMFRSFTLTRRRLNVSLAGVRSMGSMRWSGIAGTGRRGTRMGLNRT